MNKIIKMLKEKDVAEIGVGTMIVFIAMVLVAGIAASVLIQTATKLESQAMATGQETIGEVATGLAVFDIEAYSPAVTANITKLLITVRPRAGSQDIDLNQAFIEISDPSTKIILRFNTTGLTNYADHGSGASGFDDLFALHIFPGYGTYWQCQNIQNNTIDDFGILVVEDADSSCTKTNPVINRGDKVILAINTSLCFNISGSLGIQERKDIWGAVVAEQGSPGIIAFTTPASYNDKVMDLQ
jgi:archaeal flagellin FlaB